MNDHDSDISEEDFFVNKKCAQSLAADLSENWIERLEGTEKLIELCKGAGGKQKATETEINARKQCLKTINDKSFELLTDDRVEISARSAKRPKLKVINDEIIDDIPILSRNFSTLNISKPILKALTLMNHLHPTPIQHSTIPVALEGRDVCGCAITGSGKTLAFLIPVVERLTYRPKSRQTRVLILTPTRELAVQTCQVMRQLCQFLPHPIDICMAVGGFDLKSQENALRLSPDVVIATPGRLIDHLHNSPLFSLNTIEILILDEADRMLDEYFADQMNEVIRLCAKNRQTLLFSATLSEEIKDLTAVTMKDPVNICVNQREQVAPGVCQEFIRIRPTQEKDREAILLALVFRLCPKQTIVFAQTKKQCHRMYILLGLMNMKAEELHGNVPQNKRVETLQKFKNREVDVLIATDLAARGLDIVGVKTVINFTMPNSFKHYIHRVGRTARAGKRGRSISMCGDDERRMLKEIIKSSEQGQVLRRVIAPEIISKMRQCVQSAEKDINEIIELEKNERLIDMAEKELQNTEDSLSKIKEAPTRSWFQTVTEQKSITKQNNLCSHSGKKKLSKEEKRRVFKNANNNKDDETEVRVQKEIEKSIKFYARMAKKGIPLMKKASSIKNKPHFEKDLSKKRFQKKTTNNKKSKRR